MEDNEYYFLCLSWVMLLALSINIYWLAVGTIMLRLVLCPREGEEIASVKHFLCVCEQKEDLKKTELLQLKIAICHIF